MDNKGVMREQRCDTSNNKRPGDVFHPDFSFGKPGYFDISVRCSLQSQFLSRVSECPGAAGEVEKDARHEEDVVAMGGLFFPLVVETLGLWTPSSRQTIKLIALKVASISGIQLSVALKNLIQQLSIRLWIYNARMLLSILSIIGIVPNMWDIPT